MIKSITKDRRGATATEYALMVGLIALVVLGAAKIFGTTLKDKIKAQSDQVKTFLSSNPQRGRLPLQQELQTGPSCGCHRFS